MEKIMDETFENMKMYAERMGMDLVEVKPGNQKIYASGPGTDYYTEIMNDKKYLLDIMYEITRAESPKDMYDLAVDALKKYGKEPAELNY